MKQTRERSTKERIIKIVSFAITFIISYYLVQHFFFNKTDLESALREATKEINKEAPKQLDEFTRLDSATSIEDHTLQYHYTLIDLTKDEVDYETVNTNFKPYIIENVKTSPELKVFRDNNVTLSYIYNDMNGEFVISFPVTPEIYKTQ